MPDDTVIEEGSQPVPETSEVVPVSKRPFDKTGKIEVADKAAADIALDGEWEKAKLEAVSKGCAIDENGYIIPINAETGELDYEAQRTIAWSKVEEDSGKFYVLDFNYSKAQRETPPITPVVEEELPIE